MSFFFIFHHTLHISLLTAFSCFCTQLYRLLKFFLQGEFCPYTACLHSQMNSSKEKERKRKRAQGNLFSVSFVSIPRNGLSWEDCVGLRPGTYRIVTPKGWKRNAPVAERRKNMGADEDKSGHGGKTQHVPKMLYVRRRKEDEQWGTGKG